MSRWCSFTDSACHNFLQPNCNGFWGECFREVHLGNFELLQRQMTNKTNFGWVEKGKLFFFPWIFRSTNNQIQTSAYVK